MQYSRAGGPGFSTGYTMPPRGTMQQQSYPMASRTGHPTLPTTPGYLTQRGSTGNYFGPNSAMNLPMQPSANSSLPSLQQPPQSSLALQQQHQQHAQQQAPLHLGPAASQATGTSSNSSDNVIDQSEFPPLGSTTTGPQQNSNTGGSSGQQSGAAFHSTYASQAGTALTNGPTLTGGANSQQREFGHDDFPPLGSQPSSQHSQTNHGPNQGVGTGQDGHSNGYSSDQQGPGQAQDQPQAQRPLLMGGQHGNQALGGQAGAQRSMQGLPSDVDKRNFTKMTTTGQVPWSSQQGVTQGFPSSITNGQHLSAPPNLPTPASYNGQSFPQSSQPQSQATILQMQQHSLQQHGGLQDMSSLPSQTRQAGTNQSQSSAQPNAPQPNHLSNPNQTTPLPQTPAQQVLLSAADRWGLLALLASIKGTDPDAQLLGSGTDLAQMGLDLAAPGHLSSMFVTPWTDSATAQSVEPEFHLPLCYNVQAPPPGPQKVASFSDETLFFMFYSSPRDTLQEVAAQELYNRNWRYHKEARVWLTKEAGQSPLHKDASHERGTYTFFDPERWEKVKKEALIMYDKLEERALPQSLNAMNVNMAGIPLGVAGNHGLMGNMGMQAQQVQAQQLPMRG
ncbi:hypothetical protein FRB99_002593 [Tulasnella sp. 403]|nr:hypothetical protein FRB99_002593 [Tulasnella sp. 403]